MTKNIKIAVGLGYILCLSLILYGFFIFIDVTQLNDYIYIRDKTQFLIEIRDQHLLLFTTLFFLFSILSSRITKNEQIIRQKLTFYNT